MKALKLAVFGTSLLLGSIAHAQTSIKIGVLTDQSGPYSDLSGEGSIVGTKLAVEEFLAQNKGMSVAGVERMLHAPDDFSSFRCDDGSGIAFERLSEGVVGSEEEPAVAAGLYQCAACPVAQSIGVVNPMHRIGRARFTREIRTRSSGRKEHLVLVFRELADRE